MTSYHSVRKTFFLGLFMLAFSARAFATKDFNISENLLQIFKQTFPDALEVVWKEQSDRCTVNFRQGDIHFKVEYDKDGNFLGSLRYYTGKNLPVSILCRFQKIFSGKTIHEVTELDTGSLLEYYIKMEDNHDWMTVRVSIGGDLKVVAKGKK
jgi:hypothetical protein